MFMLSMIQINVIGVHAIYALHPYLSYCNSMLMPICTIVLKFIIVFVLVVVLVLMKLIMEVFTNIPIGRSSSAHGKFAQVTFALRNKNAQGKSYRWARELVENNWVGGRRWYDIWLDFIK